jgi:hypothetical protein
MLIVMSICALCANQRACRTITAYNKIAPIFYNFRLPVDRLRGAVPNACLLPAVAAFSFFPLIVGPQVVFADASI